MRRMPYESAITYCNRPFWTSCCLLYLMKIAEANWFKHRQYLTHQLGSAWVERCLEQALPIYLKTDSISCWLIHADTLRWCLMMHNPGSCRNFNPLTPGTFCQKRIFWTFWRFSAWIWVKLAPICPKRHLQHDSMPFFPLAPQFVTFLLGHAQKSKFWDSFWRRKWPTS